MLNKAHVCRGWLWVLRMPDLYRSVGGKRMQVGAGRLLVGCWAGAGRVLECRIRVLEGVVVHIADNGCDLCHSLGSSQVVFSRAAGR